MECNELVQYLSDYIDQNLEEDLVEAAQEHLATCENCRVVLDTTQKTIFLKRQTNCPPTEIVRPASANFPQ